MNLNQTQTEVATSIAASQPAVVETGVAPHLILKHDNYSVANLESYLPQRIRPRGVYETTDLESFATFLTEHRGSLNNDLTVFVDADRMSAVCPLNFREGAAYGHCDFKATMTLKQTAAYAALLQNCNRSIPQRDFVMLLEDWVDVLVAYDAFGETIPAQTAWMAVRHMTVDAARSVATTTANLSENRSVVEQVEARSNVGALPAYFEVIDSCYFGLPERTIRLRLTVSTADDHPRFKITIVGAERLMESLTQDFGGVVAQRLPFSGVLQGTFQ